MIIIWLTKNIMEKYLKAIYNFKKIYVNVLFVSVGQVIAGKKKIVAFIGMFSSVHRHVAIIELRVRSIV